MSRSAEQITLDEKIARIRKQNEEIIRRKKIIDEEIKSAKLTNAIVNTKKTYDDDAADEPSLYSDSLDIHQKTTVVYPKIGTGIRPDRRQQSKDDTVWRREREEIDNERIRRQKAASGWRREWDANKTFEVQTKPAAEKNQRDSVFQFQGGRSSENDYPAEKGGRPRADADQNRGVKVDLNQRLQSKRLVNGDGPDSTVGDGRQQERSFKDRNYNVRAFASAKLDVRSDRGPTGISREEKDVRKTLSGDEKNIPGSGSESTNCWRTSGPLNLRKTISMNHDNVPNVVLTKVTKYSGTQTQTLPKCIPWKNDYSNRDDDDDDDIAVNLSERLKNIVIRVNSDDKKEGQRVVELVPVKKADGTDTEKSAAEQTSLQKVTSNVRLLPMNHDVSSAKDFESAVNSSGSTSRQSKKVTFNDVGQSLQSETHATQRVVDDNDDDEWEDVSDEDWEDISD